MSDSSEITVCYYTTCIKIKTCKVKHKPKTSDGFCIHFDDGTKKNAIEQKPKSIGGKET